MKAVFVPFEIRRSIVVCSNSISVRR